MRRKLQLVMAAGILSTLALAQETRQNVIYERHGNFEGTAGLQTFVMSDSFSFEGNVVKNAPYSSDAVTETTQSLGDGNRISRKTKSTLYRDSEGRTRREETLGAIGPLASGDQSQMISINDPVSKTNLVLDTKNKTARKMPSPKLKLADTLSDSRKKLAEARTVYTANHPDVKKAQAVVAELERDLQTTTEGGAGAAEAKMKAEELMMHARVVQAGGGAGGGVSIARQVTSAASEKESLGTQMMEGVNAEGTRTTFTIEAGAIGNELPIKIVSERWYSPELQTVVMSKHSDPRMGETVYRLTNINRSEPSPSLFQPPADYTITDTPQRFVINTKD